MRSNQRGIAIITVVLILLLLTVLALGASMMMTQEDSTSGREDAQRAALYVAEAGLRAGEAILADVPFSNNNVNLLLRHVSTASTPAATPNVPVVPSSNTDYSLSNLGTYLTTQPGAGTELANQHVLATETDTGGRRLFYSLYVRNNPEDTGPTTNSDSKLRLLSVGWVAVDGRPIAVKILEEEWNWSGVTQSPSAQKQTNQGGTGSGLYGG